MSAPTSAEDRIALSGVLAKDGPATQDTTWFWEIVDRAGLADVPSDERGALALLCERAAATHPAAGDAALADVERLLGSRHPGMFVILKRNLFYRPKAEGYTGILDHAGIYTEAEARKHEHKPSDTTIMRWEDAPEFTSACFDDLAREHLQKQRDEARALAATLRAQIDTERREGERLRKLVEVPEDLRALSGRATPGPWTTTPMSMDLRAGRYTVAMANPSGVGNGKADRDFMAAAVNRLRAQLVAAPAQTVDDGGER